MPPFTPVLPFRAPARRRLHEDVAEQLRCAIFDGRLRAGEKLPPERELAERFQVNRTSVREAIKVLEGQGLVSVRQGDGVTVQPLVDATLDALGPMIFHGGRLDLGLLAELNEVIHPLLAEMGRLAIERRRPEDLHEIRRLRDRAADPTGTREERFGALRDILVVLADMTRNRVWQMLARRTRVLLASAPMCEARERLRRDPGRLVPLIDACLDALDAGKPDAAREALDRLVRRIGESPADGRVEPTTPTRKGTTTR
ncbi:MAG TPA: GntR family transcriptional regulator [Candidatus Limnocylindria bacterium]|nr:GntR family transcriptional regulator [Candidatus Limnocylindria bacterium]